MKNTITIAFALLALNSSAQTPVLVKDIIQAYSETVNPMSLYGYNNRVYFNAYENANDGWEPWITDGTNLGTNRIKDIYVGAGGSGPHDFIGSGNLIYFLADNGINGQELWVTDGTSTGTSMPLDINSGTGNSATTLKGLAFNNRIIFAADDGVNGEELWITDGTALGTTLLKDINTGSNEGSYPSNFCMANGFGYFSAYTVNGLNPTVQIWRTDGTSNGTVMVHSFPQGDIWDLVSDGTRLYFVINDIIGGTTYNSYPRTSNGTAVSILSSTIRANKFTIAGNRAFFSGTPVPTTAQLDKELYVSDGTSSGTYLVKDIIPGSTDGGDPLNCVAWGNRLVFSAEDGVHGRELWISDGTNSGTYMIQDINPGNPSGFTQYGGSPIIYHNRVYFSASNDLFTNLYVTDGTIAGTSPINYDALAFGIVRIEDNPYFTVADSSLYFVANYDQVGLEVYKFNAQCELPIANFTNNTGSSTIQFTSSSTDNDSLVWDFGDGGTSNQANPVHTYTSNGNFNVCLIAYNSCGNDTQCATIAITNATSLNTIEPDNSIVVYPNPASTVVNIEGVSNNTTAIIYDITGKKLIEKEIQSGKATISISLLPSGMYYLKIGEFVAPVTISK